MTTFGLLTPVLSLVTGEHATWEREAGIEEVRQVAEVADRLGYDYLTCSEHVAIPTDGPVLTGTRYWDPLATFGYLAAHTARIRLATSILVLGYHHPLDIAKRYGTLDRITGGRLILGLGLGYLQPEFALLGASFSDRGARADDALRALRASFGRAEPSYAGEYFEFNNFVVDPCGLQQDIPMWIGGRSERSLRRAVELGDAWCPFAVSPSKAAAWLDAASATAEWQERERPLEIVLGPRRHLDPMALPDEAADAVRELTDAGVTTVSLRFVHESLSHYMEQLEAMRGVIAAL
jgi:probable F420-dependent oxidoreductase